VDLPSGRPDRPSIVHADLGADRQVLASFWNGVILAAAREIVSLRRQTRLPHRSTRLAELTGAVPPQR
jgi:hypothetical protein